MSINYYSKTFPSLFFLLLFLSWCHCSKVMAQTDTVFWFAAPEVAYIGNPLPPCDRPIVMRLTAYNQAATVTISQPANGGMPNQVVNVPANTVKTVDLTNWIDHIETKPTNTAVNYGLKISSNVPVSAYYEEVSGDGVGYFPDPEIFNLKGEYALGNDFWIPAQNVLSNDSIRFSSVLLSSFNIVATEDNTNITVTPSKNVIGHAANIPFSISLDKGQTFAVTAASPSASAHLNGSHVVSDKPIAITVSDDGPMYYTGGDDLGGDQIVPTKYLGKEYVAINGLLNMPGDIVFVIATENKTKVYKDGIYVSTINAGETQQIPLNENASYITTSAPSAVWQLSGVGVQTGQILLPKLICTGSKSASFIRSVEGALSLNIVVPSGGESGFSVNGNNNVLTNSQFSAVPGTAGAWMYCRLSLPLGSYPMGSKIKIDNPTANFQMGVINGYTNRGANVSYFADFNSGSTILNITAQPNPACVGDDIQLATTNDPSASYIWQGPNGFSSNVYNPLLANV
ncbi:MAG TPA: IgGFc-binding protein, partial [Edaphocola sp.]|nr:IgGFc-binding protein [Edaphocola sp.]